MWLTQVVFRPQKFWLIEMNLGSVHSSMSRHFLSRPVPTHSRPSLQSPSLKQPRVSWSHFVRGVHLLLQHLSPESTVGSIKITTIWKSLHLVGNQHQSSSTKCFYIYAFLKSHLNCNDYLELMNLQFVFLLPRVLYIFNPPALKH